MPEPSTTPETQAPAAPPADAGTVLSDPGGGVGQPPASALPEWVRTGVDPAMLAELEKDAPTLTRFKTAADLAKESMNWRRAASAAGIQVPKDDDPPEKWANFRKAIGVPEKIDGYKAAVESVAPPAGLERDPAIEGQLLEYMHANGYTPKQAKAGLEFYYRMAADGVVEQERQALQRRNDWRAETKKAFGAAFDERVVAARQALTRIGPEGDRLKELLNATGLGDHPVVLSALSAWGARIGEHGWASGGGAPVGTRTPAEARRSLAAITGDRSHAYWHPDSPGYEAAKAEFQRLNKEAYPEAGA